MRLVALHVYRSRSLCMRKRGQESEWEKEPEKEHASKRASESVSSWSWMTRAKRFEFGMTSRFDQQKCSRSSVLQPRTGKDRY